MTKEKAFLGNWGGFAACALRVFCSGGTVVGASPKKVNESMRPVAQYNMSRAEELSIACQELLSQADGQLPETRDSEERIKIGEEYLRLAHTYFVGGNYIAANYCALKAVEAYEEAVNLLTGF